MNSILKPGARVTMDPIGLLYAGTSNKDFPNNYTISVYLHEEIEPEILQLAVNDIFKRIPIVNGKLVETETCFYHEVLEETPLIQKDKGLYPYEQYYLEASRHSVRVVYGDMHFKVEAMHFITDGRSTTEIAKGILIRYYELMGIKVEKGYGVDVRDRPFAEESINAFEKFSTLSEMNEIAESCEEETVVAYRHEGSKLAVPHVTTLHFDLTPLKTAAKSYGVTLNTYIQAQLMDIVAQERDARKSNKQISFGFAGDCRPYFGVKTFRNFATGGGYYLGETLPFEGIVEMVNKQTKELNKEYFQKSINQMQSMQIKCSGLPIAKQKEILHEFHEFQFKSTTSILSNIGLVELPPSITGKVKNMEFSISQDGNPYTYSIITVNKTLTMTITSSCEGFEIETEIKKRFEEAMVKSAIKTGTVRQEPVGLMAKAQ